MQVWCSYCHTTKRCIWISVTENDCILRYGEFNSLLWSLPCNCRALSSQKKRSELSWVLCCWAVTSLWWAPAPSPCQGGISQQELCTLRPAAPWTPWPPGTRRSRMTSWCHVCRLMMTRRGERISAGLQMPSFWMRYPRCPLTLFRPTKSIGIEIFCNDLGCK